MSENGSQKAQGRITEHPVLDVPKRDAVDFSWSGSRLKGFEGEAVSSALIANGVHIFGTHHKDGSPQGIFCANGQCSACLVLIDGRPVKSCMTPLRAGMKVEPVKGLPKLPADDATPAMAAVQPEDVDVLVIGGGPAGLTASIELGKAGVETILIDDKDRLGGKLVLQTHKFFGSVDDSHAGTRGYKIGEILSKEVSALPSVKVWLESTAVAVFSDGVVGVVRKDEYRLIRPKRLLVASGARERMLPFPGNTLPGVYGAGAFQTLVNRDLVRSSERILIVGGGNVGLIAGYHAIQAGMTVVALVEALPQAGGYKVHADKLKRLGVPILTSHTVLAANGKDQVESVTIAQIGKDWKPLSGTERVFKVDTVLIAVGLAEVNEFHLKAREYGMKTYAAGDSQEVAEASAAMFSGRIEGLKIAASLGKPVGDIPKEWEEKAKVLKSKPGPTREVEKSALEEGVMPVFHCSQEVPCNPCSSICPIQGIQMERGDLMSLPKFVKEGKCIGCGRCVAICPGLAVTLVDYRKDADHPLVTIPLELGKSAVKAGDEVKAVDVDGNLLGQYAVVKASAMAQFPSTLLVQLKADRAVAKRIVSARAVEPLDEPLERWQGSVIPDDAIVCRCERVTAGQIRSAVRAGVRDMNQLKGATKSAMGACGGKTCRPLVARIFREEGVDPKEVADFTQRPLFIEVPLGLLAGAKEGRR